MHKTLLIALFLCSIGLYAQDGPPPGASADPWKSLRFLIGTWQAKVLSGSAAASASGSYTFQLELRNHVLARHAWTGECKGPVDFNCEHTDLLYLYQDAGAQAVRAIYFDNEGHIIRYEVTTPTPDTAIFVSDQAQPGPRFRLVYELKGAVMFGKFQMQTPGQTDFKSYLEWSGEKK